MKEHVNYNFMALQGIDIDDEEYAKEFGAPPNLAYTPELNNWMLNYAFDRDVQELKKAGLTESEAIARANKSRDASRAEIRQMVAERGLLK